MNTEVTFKSGRFRPVLPDECQVNPGRYGAELAFWLCAELAKAGVITSYPQYEDWGWFIEYITEAGDEYWLCCGNVDGTDDEWTCFIGSGQKTSQKQRFENQPVDVEDAGVRCPGGNKAQGSLRTLRRFIQRVRLGSVFGM